jgi:hypothetical protein
VGALRLLRGAGVCLIIGLVMLFLLSVQTVNSGKNAATSTLSPAVGEWHIETVDTTARGNSSIAVDSSGYPRISYVVDDSSKYLAYARWTGAQWVKEMVASMWSVSTDTSLVLEGNGYPHISYSDCNPYSCSAKYAEWTGSAWSVTGDIDGNGSLVLDTSSLANRVCRMG